MVNDFGEILRTAREQERKFGEVERSFKRTVWTFAVGLGIAGTLSLCTAIYIPQKDKEECVQQSQQQRFSEGLCSDVCFRNSYLELQWEYKVDDLNLAYRIAIRKCEGE